MYMHVDVYMCVCACLGVCVGDSVCVGWVGGGCGCRLEANFEYHSLGVIHLVF